MCKLAIFLISAWLLSGCSDAGAPAPSSATAPESEAENTALAEPENKGVSSEKSIIVVADPWCPHNCKAGAAKEGYMIDIAREAMAEAGYTLEYRNFSWARALRMTRNGSFHAVVGAFRTDAPDFIFPDLAQGRASIALFTHPDNGWVYSGPESLQGQTLLAINGYSYTAELDTYIERYRNDPDRVLILSGSTPLQRAIAMLDQHRVGIVAADDYVMAWVLRKNPDIAGNRPRKAGEVSETPSFIAFSPALENSKQLARLLTEGTRKLIENGRARTILESYGLTWFPGTENIRLDNPVQ